MQERGNYTIAIDALHLDALAVTVGHQKDPAASGTGSQGIVGRIADHDRLRGRNPELGASSEDGNGGRPVPCNRLGRKGAGVGKR